VTRFRNSHIGNAFNPWIVVAIWGLSTACARGGRHEPLVPESNQQESKERYGEQELMMDDLNQTPAERASANHHRDSATPAARRGDADGRDQD
jgi:hypothetical protein